MTERIGTLALHRRVTDEFLKTQADLSKLQTQISSGVKAQAFNEVGADLPRLLNLNALIGASDSYITQNSNIINRLQATDLALKQFQDIAKQLSSNLLLKRSSSGAQVPLANLSNNLLDEVAGTLNTQIEGRFIFSGSKTNIRPVQDIHVSNLILDTPSDNYYSGDDKILSTNVTEDLNVAYGITGNNIAFKDIIGALNHAILGDSGSDEELVKAVDMVNKAISELSSLRNSVGNNMKSIIDANSQHSAFQTYLKQAQSEIIGTDIPSATIQVSLDQTILQASFQVYAKLSSFFLGDFLR